MKFLDPNDKFFRSPIVRVATVLLPVGWSVVEFVWLGSSLWGVVFLGAGVYAGWELFFNRSRD